MHTLSCLAFSLLHSLRATSMAFAVAFWACVVALWACAVAFLHVACFPFLLLGFSSSFLQVGTFWQAAC